MGVVIADLPRVETLARSVGETIRTLGSEARTQAGDLEVGLSRLARESSAAQEASAIATQRITTQETQIELATERTCNQIETLTARLNATVQNELVRTPQAVPATHNSVHHQSEPIHGPEDADTLTHAPQRQNTVEET